MALDLLEMLGEFLGKRPGFIGQIAHFCGYGKRAMIWRENGGMCRGKIVRDFSDENAGIYRENRGDFSG